MRFRLTLDALRSAGAVSIAIAALTILVAACDSASTSSGSADPVGPDDGLATAPTCALVPASLVNSTLGTTVGEPSQQVNATVTVCQYAPTSGFNSVLVRFQVELSPNAFGVGRAGFEASDQPTTDVPGLLDEAYSSTLGSGETAVTTVVARKGSVEILVTASVPVDKQKALIQTIADSLS